MGRLVAHYKERWPGFLLFGCRAGAGAARRRADAGAGDPTAGGGRSHDRAVRNLPKRCCYAAAFDAAVVKTAASSHIR